MPLQPVSPSPTSVKVKPMQKHEKTTLKDWLIVLVALLDEVLVLALIFIVLWIFGVKVPLSVIIVVALLLVPLAIIIHRTIIPSLHKRKVVGAEGMVGLEAEVVEPLTPAGVVSVGGEYWKAKSVAGDIAAGEMVEVTGLNRLTLEVKRKEQ